MQSTAEAERERLRVAALRAYRILDTAVDPRFDRLARLVTMTFGVPIALVTLLDEHRQWFKARIGLDVMETARAVSIKGRR